MPVDAAHLLTVGALLLSTGVLAGLMAGLLGVGGGLVTVPVLYQVLRVFGVDTAVGMKLAIGTSLATILATGWSSGPLRCRPGAIDRLFLSEYGPVIVAGVVVGSVVSMRMGGPALIAAFAVPALALCVHMIIGGPRWRMAEHPPGGWKRFAIGGAIGALAGMMGGGGGTVTVPLLTAYGRSIRRASRTAAATSVLIGLPGSLAFAIGGWHIPSLPPFSLGYVSLPAFALIAPSSILALPWGLRLAEARHAGLLRLLFAASLSLAVIGMAAGILA